MPLIFVHGVNNRRSKPGFERNVQARSSLFRKFLLTDLKAPDEALILNPYWGDDGADFRWGLACLPDWDTKAAPLGRATPGTGIAAVAAVGLAAAPAASPDAVLTEIAKSPSTETSGPSFIRAVDLMFSASMRAAEIDEESDLATLAKHAMAYAFSEPEPQWVKSVRDDRELVTRLKREVETFTQRPAATEAGPVGLGVSDVWGNVRAGVDRLIVEAGNLVGKTVWNTARDLAAPTVAHFLGDVVVYQSKRGTPSSPGPIPKVIIDDLEKASSVRSERDPLIVVGHSLGGVICYDILTAFRGDIHVDILCTVGSQVGLFEEMKVFVASDDQVPGPGRQKVSPPPNVPHWINIFDFNDILSFELSPLMDGVTDYPYPTGELLNAHGAYFGQPAFHQRLSRRVQEALGKV
ncbi:hypothetical protein [Streptomyces iakyrus]|uniref:hypothetical protein n=1 Tax=Streptomyces iakyrus TaxID=68219 RepID=UPI003D8DBBAE